jgi:hypothetical protein
MTGSLTCYVIGNSKLWLEKEYTVHILLYSTRRHSGVKYCNVSNQLEISTTLYSITPSLRYLVNLVIVQFGYCSGETCDSTVLLNKRGQERCIVNVWKKQD